MVTQKTNNKFISTKDNKQKSQTIKDFTDLG